eukprot:scaffold2655_cov77-Phaeocystis_antarctica.AAC.3
MRMYSTVLFELVSVKARGSAEVTTVIGSKPSEMLGGGWRTRRKSGVTEAPPSFSARTRYLAALAPWRGVPEIVPSTSEKARPNGSAPPLSPLGVALMMVKVRPSCPPELVTALLATASPQV